MKIGPVFEQSIQSGLTAALFFCLTLGDQNGTVFYADEESAGVKRCRGGTANSVA